MNCRYVFIDLKCRVGVLSQERTNAHCQNACVVARSSGFNNKIYQSQSHKCQLVSRGSSTLNAETYS